MHTHKKATTLDSSKFYNQLTKRCNIWNKGKSKHMFIQMCNVWATFAEGLPKSDT